MLGVIGASGWTIHKNTNQAVQVHTEQDIGRLVGVRQQLGGMGPAEFMLSIRLQNGGILVVRAPIGYPIESGSAAAVSWAETAQGSVDHRYVGYVEGSVE
ncbi:MAG: hypothetical protein KDJ27_12625 [Gammaproteobacteria bacterium]|nr:hypothetical protein [Gammaproteobacteria bacterium]